MKRGKGIDADLVLARIMDEGADAAMSRGEAVAIVAARVKKPDEGLRAARNRIGMKLDRSQNRSTDVGTGGLASLPDGRFAADEISRWARREYPGVFPDLPLKSRLFKESIEDTVRVSTSLSMEVLPGSVERCHAFIEAQRAELSKLRKQIESFDITRRRELGERFKRPAKK